MSDRNKIDFVDLQQFDAFFHICEENTTARDSDLSSHRTDVWYLLLPSLRTEVTNIPGIFSP